MFTKVEFSCEMTCDSCKNKVENYLNDLQGLKIDSIDVPNQRVVIQIDETFLTTLPDLQDQIENETGLKTVIKGVGENLSTVSEIDGPNNLIGVIRMAQMSNNRCLVDGIVDRVTVNSPCSLNIHEYGDLRGTSFDHVGPIIVPIMANVRPIQERCLFRGYTDNCDLSSVIGRALVISDQESNKRLGAGIIARASPIYGNEKKVCLCSGETLWDEREKKKKTTSIEYLSFSWNDLVIQKEHLTVNQASAFDLLLESKWSKAYKINDLFRYKIDRNSLIKRVLPGSFNFIITYNPGRGSLRRTPEHVTSTQMPFNGSRFNFNQIKQEERLFRVFNSVDDEQIFDIIINNSPIEYCSSLMVPNPEQCLPQILTDSSLTMAIALVGWSTNYSFRMGFNSLGAAASVNHLHWHLYYLDEPLRLESVSVDFGNFFSSWPLPGFLFEINSLNDVDQTVKKIMILVDQVYTNSNHAYNLFITRSRVYNNIRVFFWVRQACFGLKANQEINPALCEFSGFFICKTEELMHNIDQDYCVETIKSVEFDIDDYIQTLDKLSLPL